jgi:hypothetical protein
MYAATKTATPVEDVREGFTEIRDEVLSRTSLWELVLRPSLDLYPSERRWRSREEIIANMRANDLRIDYMSTTPNSPDRIMPVRISFTYPDRFKTQAVVREIVAKFNKRRVRTDGSRAPGETRAETIAVEVLDPAGLPE